MNIKAIVTDIEGTTTSLAFVKDVLFPYARERLKAFLLKYHNESHIKPLLEEVETLAGKSMEPGQVVTLLQQWIDEDRKVTPLKTIQGYMWELGYRNGDFTGHVYEDAVEMLRKWHNAGVLLYVYSSGSVKAQKLLYGHTPFGDLTGLFTGYFDTNIGGKKEPASYTAIIAAIDQPPEQVLFLSDVAEELEAAKAAGLITVQLIREGQAPAPGHAHVENFYSIDISQI